MDKTEKIKVGSDVFERLYNTKGTDFHFDYSVEATGDIWVDPQAIYSSDNQVIARLAKESGRFEIQLTFPVSANQRQLRIYIKDAIKLFRQVLAPRRFYAIVSRPAFNIFPLAKRELIWDALVKNEYIHTNGRISKFTGVKLNFLTEEENSQVFKILEQAVHKGRMEDVDLGKHFKAPYRSLVATKDEIVKRCEWLKSTYFKLRQKYPNEKAYTIYGKVQRRLRRQDFGNAHNKLSIERIKAIIYSK